MKKFLKNTYAATAIEFAIILPVLLLFLIGIFQFGLTLFFDSSLNTGIRAVARQGVANGFTSNTQINDIMNANLGGLYDPQKATIKMIAYDKFNYGPFYALKDTFYYFPDSPFYGLSHGDMDTILDPAQQSGKIIIYGVKYDWGNTFGIPNPFLPKFLYSYSIVRNEKYD